MAEDIDDKDRGAWWVFGLGGLGALALLIAYLRFRSGFAVGTLEAHAQLGDALGPVVAFLTLFTVVAALWSVQIQRVELALQRKELQSTRDEMVEQRKQFERTAKAQEDLANSQARLADEQAKGNDVTERLVAAQRQLSDEQAHSNEIAMRAQLGQRSANIASLEAAVANVNAAVAQTWNNSDGFEKAAKQVRPTLDHLRQCIDAERDAARALQQLVTSTILERRKGTDGLTS
jgi:hypothetical protein